MLFLVRLVAWPRLQCLPLGGRGREAAILAWVALPPYCRGSILKTLPDHKVAATDSDGQTEILNLLMG